MSLTAKDLEQITAIVNGAIQTQVPTIVNDAIQTQVPTIVDVAIRAQVRPIIESVLQADVIPRIDLLSGEVQALRSDIKEIYSILADLQSGTVTDRSFAKLSLEDKLLRLNAELLAAAKQAGIALPR